MATSIELTYLLPQYCAATWSISDDIWRSIYFVRRRFAGHILVIGLLTIILLSPPRWNNSALPVGLLRPTWRQRLAPLTALLALIALAVTANSPASAALSWDGEMEPLPQYRTYCQTYGPRDPGCHASLGGEGGAERGPDRLPSAGDATLGMAVLVHRQVVADLLYRTERQDVWQVLGTLGSGMEGDCDDVVMTTISRLLRRGFPRAALRATVVRLPDDGGYHLILAVRTSQPGGRMVEQFLDDRHRRPLRAEDLMGYRFVAQEVPGGRKWRRAAERTENENGIDTAG